MIYCNTIHEERDMEVMLVTGQLDKGFHQIYEGDFVRYPNGHVYQVMHGTVTIPESDGPYENQCIGFYLKDIATGLFRFPNGLKDSEIIGNIYEGVD